MALNLATEDVLPAGEPATPGLPAGKTRGMFARGLEAFLENRLAIAGVIILAAIFAFCFLGPFVYHTDQIHVNLGNENLSPGAGRPLGTDDNGYDILGRLMVGGQISLEVGLAAAVLATCLGTLWGAVAGYFGGLVDAVMMRLVDALLSIPTLFLALVVASMFPPTETELILVIALTSWLTTSRLISGEALSLRVRDYVQAMRVMGGSSARAVFRHIAPNAVGTIVVNTTFQVADAILTVVALSSIGGFTLAPQTVGSVPDFLVADGLLGSAPCSCTVRSLSITAITSYFSARSTLTPDAIRRREET